MDNDSEIDEKEVSAAETKKDKAAAPWLSLIDDAKRAYSLYHDKADTIDKLYGDLETLAGASLDRQFQIFWANLEVLKPSIYARPPVPVVTPRFKDRAPIPSAAAGLLERALISDFDTDDIDNTMRAIRDDLATVGRGAVWLRYGSDGRNERAWAEHVDRKDFLHAPARKWAEVDWVARRVWVSLKDGRKRFGDVFLDAAFEERGIGASEDGDYKGVKKAEVWEIWHKYEQVVVWVSPNTEEVLDIQEPFLDLEGFFPCPRPAYGTLQRGTMIPVPDFVYYKDQIEEINELTARISSLSEALRMKGFYPSGAGDVAEAIEAVMKNSDNNAILVPVNNFAALGGASLRESIIWLPVGEIANVIEQLLGLRRQMIDDVYQITGLSDIMRGVTDAKETLGAQQLKSQYGSVRVRDRQNELIRIARDITRLKAEIMAENFEPKTLLDMSQVSDLPSEQDLQQQAEQIKQQTQQQAAQALQQPQAAQQAQQNPQQAKQMVQQAIQQARKQMDEIMSEPSVEKVMQLLREQRLRPFILDIETDSTIQPDEDREKARRTEFLTAVGGFIAQTVPMIQAEPATAPFVAEALKFTAAGFRAGRELDGTIDEFAETIKEIAEQRSGGPSPEQQAEMQTAKSENDKTEAETNKIAAETAAIVAEMQKPPEQGPPAPTPPTPFEVQAQQNEQQVAEAKAKNDNDRVQLDTRKVALDEAQLMADTEQKRGELVQATNEQLIAAGYPPGYDFSQDQNRIDETVKSLSAQTEAQGERIAEALQILAAALTAPKKVIRDASGKAVGVESAPLVTVKPSSEEMSDFAEAITAPKKVVRNADGKTTGVKTVKKKPKKTRRK